ncbi:SDR family NAD(P)-dependent oxidoreductase [Paraburkholderia fungorum]
MQIDLTGKTVIVTGSTAGIGLAAVKGLATSGSAVVLTRSQTSVDRALAAVRAELPDATVTGFAGDLGTTRDCAALVATHPDCDILVNNRDIYGPQDFFKTPDDTWLHFLQVNVLSGVRLARAYLPDMTAKGWGRVVFVSSESALNIPADMIYYGVTKTTQLSLARGLAKRVAGSGVTVNAVLPGPTLSDGLASMLRDEADRSGKPLKQVAAEFVMANRPSSIIQRAASVEEIANIIVYACSPQASATTGAALRVDGGVVDSL